MRKNYRSIISGAKEKKTIVTDFDGTLAEFATYPEIGKPKKNVIEKLRKLHDEGYEIVVSSCRFNRKDEEEARNEEEYNKELKTIKAWLKSNNVPYDRLWMQEKPKALVYLDDRAVNVNDLDSIDKLLEDK